MIRNLTIVLMCTLAACGGFAFYAGLFDKVSYTVEQPGPFNIVYREYDGPHQGVRLVMNQVYRYVQDSLKSSTDTGCVIFYSLPNIGKDDSLRCLSGIIVDSVENKSTIYKSATIRQADALVGRCYLRSFFSYMTGSYKFYSELQQVLEKYQKKQNGPVIEMYDMVNRTLIYIAPCNQGASPVPLYTGK